MIKTDTAVGQARTIDDNKHMAWDKSADAKRRSSDADVVEISEECKKRLVMSNLKASLSAVDGVKGRYNR